MFLKKRLRVVFFLSACFFAYAMEEREDQPTDLPGPSLGESELKVVQELEKLCVQAKRLGIDCIILQEIITEVMAPVNQCDQDNDQLSSGDACRKLKKAQALLSLRTMVAEKKKEIQRKKLSNLLKAKKN